MPTALPPQIDSGISNGQRILLSIEPAAEYLDTNVRHLRGLVAQRRIPHYKVGSKLRFDLSDLNDWLDSNKVEAVK